MPIARGLVPVPPTPVTPAPTRRVIDPPGVYLAEWTAPDGTVLDLNPAGQTWWSLRGNAGLGAVPVEHITVNDPGGGVIVEGTRVRERTVLWPLRMRATTHLGLIETWRRITGLFTQTRDLGPGRLTVYRPDGTAREILAYYASGLEVEPEDGAWLQVTPVINLLCPDPFWRSTTEVVKEYREADRPTYLDPYMTVSSGRVFGATTLTNDGARPVWPSWRIRGPMTAITATNTTRGEAFTLTHTLAAGDELTISGRPIQIRGPAGENLIAGLDLVGGGGKPWRLDPRTESQITFAVTGSAEDSAPGADDGTRLWLTYSIDYETA